MVALPRLSGPLDWMSVDEFLAWDLPDGLPWQLVDGVPQAMAPANRTHSAIQSELGSLLRNHLAERGSPCSVLTTPGIVPHVNARRNVRISDLAVTCTEYEAEEATLSDPVLLVEILSRSNQPETWSNVWTYTTIPSVREILIVRAASVSAELLRRNPDGTWPDRPLAVEESDEVMLECVGFATPLSALYRTTRLAQA